MLSEVARPLNTPRLPFRKFAIFISILLQLLGFCSIQPKSQISIVTETLTRLIYNLR
jgi:hypothetical protein